MCSIIAAINQYHLNKHKHIFVVDKDRAQGLASSFCSRPHTALTYSDNYLSLSLSLSLWVVALVGGATRDSCLRETFQTIPIAEHAIIRFDLIAVIVVVFLPTVSTFCVLDFM